MSIRPLIGSGRRVGWMRAVGHIDAGCDPATSVVAAAGGSVVVVVAAGSDFTAVAVVVVVSTVGDAGSGVASEAPPPQAPATKAMARSVRNLRMVGLR
jgi:hypothetical protein